MELRHGRPIGTIHVPHRAYVSLVGVAAFWWLVGGAVLGVLIWQLVTHRRPEFSTLREALVHPGVWGLAWLTCLFLLVGVWLVAACVRLVLAVRRLPVDDSGRLDDLPTNSVSSPAPTGSWRVEDGRAIVGPSRTSVFVVRAFLAYILGGIGVTIGFVVWSRVELFKQRVALCGMVLLGTVFVFACVLAVVRFLERLLPTFVVDETECVFRRSRNELRVARRNVVAVQLCHGGENGVPGAIDVNLVWRTPPDDDEPRTMRTTVFGGTVDSAVRIATRLADWLDVPTVNHATREHWRIRVRGNAVDHTRGQSEPDFSSTSRSRSGRSL